MGHRNARRTTDRPESASLRRRRSATLLAVVALTLGGAVVGPVASAGAAPAKGEPVVVHFANLDATSSTLTARQGARAAVKSVNAAGGVGGRPVKLVECLTDQTPERGKTCVDQAVTAKPVAVVAVQPGGVSENLAALTGAGIPYVGQTCNTNATLSGQYSSFCFGSDLVGLFTSSAAYLKSLGTVKTAALAYPNVPAASTGVKAFGVPAFARAGIATTEVPIPEGTADAATVITPALAANPQALVGLLNGPACVAAMKARGTRTLPVIFPALCTDPEAIADAGTAAVGSLFVRQTVTIDPANADVKAYTKAMKRYASDTDRNDVFAQAGFAVVMNLVTALRTVPAGTALDATAATNALRAGKAVPLFLGGGTTYTCDGTAAAGLKGLCSLQAHVLAYDGKGRWTDRGVF